MNYLDELRENWKQHLIFSIWLYLLLSFYGIIGLLIMTSIIIILSVFLEWSMKKEEKEEEKLEEKFQKFKKRLKENNTSFSDFRQFLNEKYRLTPREFFIYSTFDKQKKVMTDFAKTVKNANSRVNIYTESK